MKMNYNLEVMLTNEPAYSFQDAMRESTVYCEQLPYGLVSDSLSSVFRGWTPEVPVAIFSDTGTGKSHFIENILAPEASFYKQKILLVSNRVALGRQTKRRLAKKFNEEWKLADYSDQGIDKITDFRHITVVSFQQLAEWLNQNSNNLDKLKRNFRYVVFDEIHYCLSDCGFNAMTDIVLEFIMSEFQDSIKIFMTATPEQIFPVLVKKQVRGGMVYDGNGWKQGLYQWHVYQFAHDFSQIIPHAFLDVEDIVALIRKTDAKDKTVVFVESRELGNAIIQKCGFGSMVTSDSKYPQGFSYEIYSEIVKSEKFDGRLLVCTAVLENGINLKDTKIKNVVIFANDKTRFLQMLGRVRREPEQQINIYIQNESMSEISYRIEALKAQSKAFSMYYADTTAFCTQFITDNNPRAKVRGAFTIMQDGSAHVNELRKIQIDYFELPFWVKIKEQMENGDQYALLKEKFSWVAREFTERDVLLGNRHDRALHQFMLLLESAVGARMEKDKQEEFKRTFSERYRAVYGRREEDKTSGQMYGLATIKDCLAKSELPYVLASERGSWIIERVEQSIVGGENNEEEN